MDSKHWFTGYTISKDDFFKNPNKVIELSNDLEYHRSEIWPGERTINLFEIKDDRIADLVKYMTKRLSVEIFPGIYKYLLDLRFHRNYSYQDEMLNQGWIHSDDCQLAGIIYLNKESNYDSGTSIFEKNSNVSFDRADFSSRLNFNLYDLTSDEYKKDLKNNHKQFSESIKFGMKFNRLVGYDAQMFHRPNNYKVLGPKRLTLLFFIDRYNFNVPDIGEF